MKIKHLIFVVLLFSVLFTACSGETDNELISESQSKLDNETAVNEATSAPLPEQLENEFITENILPGNAVSSDRCFYGESDSSDTYTGLASLPFVNFENFSFPDTDKYSSEMISHSYGVAKDEIPHTISKDYQKYFDEMGFDSVCLDNQSQNKVLYLTFDCGYENGYTAKILDVLKEKNVPAAFFCTLPQVKSSPEIVARMINEGHIVGNHSVTHPDFSGLSTEEIVSEIKVFDDYIRKEFGYSSLYFRYPQGKYSEKSTYVINRLGYKCVFWSLAYADWDVENPKGAEFAYETVMSRIHPGAVILLHAVSPDNAGALGDIIDSAREKGYSFASLEELGK